MLKMKCSVFLRRFPVGCKQEWSILHWTPTSLATHATRVVELDERGLAAALKSENSVSVFLVICTCHFWKRDQPMQVCPVPWHVLNLHASQVHEGSWFTPGWTLNWSVTDTQHWYGAAPLSIITVPTGHVGRLYSTLGIIELPNLTYAGEDCASVER